MTRTAQPTGMIRAAATGLALRETSTTIRRTLAARKPSPKPATLGQAES